MIELKLDDLKGIMPKDTVKQLEDVRKEFEKLGVDAVKIKVKGLWFIIFEK